MAEYQAPSETLSIFNAINFTNESEPISTTEARELFLPLTGGRVVGKTTFTTDVNIGTLTCTGPSYQNISFTTLSNNKILTATSATFLTATVGCVDVGNYVFLPSGSTGLPSVNFINGTGLYSPSTSQMAVLSNTSVVCTFTSVSTVFSLPTTHNSQLLAGTGSVTLPSYSFSADTDTGMYMSVAGVLAFIANATNSVVITPTTMRPPTAGTNTISCGASGALWTAIWASNGTIQTSDKTKKENITPLEPDYEMLHKLNPAVYQWKEDIAKLPSDKKELVDGFNPHAKKYCGLIAQDLKDAEITTGYHEEDFVDDDGVNGTFYGINYSEFIAPMLRIIQDMEKRIKELEKK